MKELGDGYRIRGKINPFYLRGDFDGDGKPDYAVLLGKGDQQGIAVCRSGAKKPVLLGAGTALNEMKNLDFDAWQVHPKARPFEQGNEEPKPPVLFGDAIFIEWEQSASAVLYWDGKQFIWYQQGD